MFLLVFTSFIRVAGIGCFTSSTWVFLFTVSISLEEATLPSSLRPLSALQRLSLAQSTQQDKPSLVSLAKISQQSSSTTLKYMKPNIPTQTPSISKLSLLAQSKRVRAPLDPSSGSSAWSNFEDTKATSTVQSKLALKSLKSKEVSIKHSSLEIEKQSPVVQETYSHPPSPDLLGSPSLFARTLSSFAPRPNSLFKQISFSPSAFGFETPSPDDLVLQARQKTSLPTRVRRS